MPVDKCPFTRMRCYKHECGVWNLEAMCCGLLCPILPDYAKDLKSIHDDLTNIYSALKGER